VDVFLDGLNGSIALHILCAMTEWTDLVSSDDAHLMKACLKHMLASVVAEPIALIVSAITILNDFDVAGAKIAKSLVCPFPDLEPALKVPGSVVIRRVVVMVR
jgi:hypothetical protein